MEKKIAVHKIVRKNEDLSWLSLYKGTLVLYVAQDGNTTEVARETKVRNYYQAADTEKER